MVIDFSHSFIPNLFMNCTNAITLSVLLQLPNFSTVTPAYLRIGPVRTGAEMDMWELFKLDYLQAEYRSCRQTSNMKALTCHHHHYSACTISVRSSACYQ